MISKAEKFALKMKKYGKRAEAEFWETFSLECPKKWPNGDLCAVDHEPTTRWKFMKPTKNLHPLVSFRAKCPYCKKISHFRLFK